MASVDYRNVREVIVELKFVPSITSMQKIMRKRYGYAPARPHVYKIYQDLVSSGAIYETGMNPTWAYRYPYP